jgi:hypothetical protein
VKETIPQLRRLTLTVAPFLGMAGAVMGIRATFEAVARGIPVADAARVGFWYGPLAGLVGMLVGLVAVLLSPPWRQR